MKINGYSEIRVRISDKNMSGFKGNTHYNPPYNNRTPPTHSLPCRFTSRAQFFFVVKNVTVANCPVDVKAYDSMGTFIGKNTK